MDELAIVGIVPANWSADQVVVRAGDWLQAQPRAAGTSLHLLAVHGPGHSIDLRQAPSCGEVEVWQYRSQGWLTAIESAQNVVASKIDAQALAFCSMDCVFPDPGWWLATRRALDKHPLVQPFRDITWSRPEDGRLCSRTSVGWKYRSHKLPMRAAAGRCHPGLCWAARRDLWTTGPGLADFRPYGGNATWLSRAAMDDVHVGCSYGAAWNSLLRNYAADLLGWMGVEEIGSCDQELRAWTGEHGAAGFQSWRITRLKGTDPDRDLARDGEGLLAWTAEGIRRHARWAEAKLKPTNGPA